jgi:hypothetical protein
MEDGSHSCDVYRRILSSAHRHCPFGLITPEEEQGSGVIVIVASGVVAEEKTFPREDFK